jgi:hypothetical protein
MCAIRKKKKKKWKEQFDSGEKYNWDYKGEKTFEVVNLCTVQVAVLII